MRPVTDTNRDNETPILLPDTKRIWLICIPFGLAFWAIALLLWAQQGIDEAGLFYFDAARVANDLLVILSQWLTSYGMALITAIFVLYLLLSNRFKRLDAPLTIYLYTICSFGLSGIAGDLLKQVFARPRPVITYGSEILVLSQAVTPALPSGHTAKSIALILPFIFLVPSVNNNIHKLIKIIITLIASGVCFSRIVLGVHYVSDVAAGVGMALIGLPFSILFAIMILKQTKAEQLPALSKVWGALLVFLTIVFMIL